MIGMSEGALPNTKLLTFQGDLMEDRPFVTAVARQEDRNGDRSTYREDNGLFRTSGLSALSGGLQDS